MWSNKIMSEYKYNRNRLENMFPEAYDFLRRIESINHLKFHIGTSTNLHLYYEDNFLVYIKIEPPLKFYLSPNYNERLKKDASKNNPNMFFIPFKKELEKHNLYPEYENGIIRIRANKDAKLYFDCCLKAIADIAEMELSMIKEESKWHV